jgi:hypothetical protein
MRIWTLHPRYLDPVGLVALWREALLAKAVLGGSTRGYTRHPQLVRFRAQPDPLGAINAYLAGVHEEATARGYTFAADKVGVCCHDPIDETAGQLGFEWEHLLRKLSHRQPERCEELRRRARPTPHPLFRIVPGPVREWERGPA